MSAIVMDPLLLTTFMKCFRNVLNWLVEYLSKTDSEEMLDSESTTSALFDGTSLSDSFSLGSVSTAVDDGVFSTSLISFATDFSFTGSVPSTDLDSVSFGFSTTISSVFKVTQSSLVGSVLSRAAGV